MVLQEATVPAEVMDQAVDQAVDHGAATVQVAVPVVDTFVFAECDTVPAAATAQAVALVAALTAATVLAVATTRPVAFAE